MTNIRQPSTDLSADFTIKCLFNVQCYCIVSFAINIVAGTDNTLLSWSKEWTLAFSFDGLGSQFAPKCAVWERAQSSWLNPIGPRIIVVARLASLWSKEIKKGMAPDPWQILYAFSPSFINRCDAHGSVFVNEAHEANDAKHFLFLSLQQFDQTIRNAPPVEDILYYNDSL